jgi:hypothetical protein
LNITHVQNKNSLMLRHPIRFLPQCPADFTFSAMNFKMHPEISAIILNLKQY